MTNEEKRCFEQELSDLCNKHCKENDSGTPDFLLAQFIVGYLKSFNDVVSKRENWYGRNPNPLV